MQRLVRVMPCREVQTAGKGCETARVGKERKEGKVIGRGSRSLDLEKAAGLTRSRASPERVAPNLLEGSLAWKQKSAPFWPSAPL